jgi:purine-nucleoside phosphorylase
MLKVLVLIDCDACGHALPQAQLCSLADARDWRIAGFELLDEVRQQADELGWHFAEGRIHCSDCADPPAHN